MSVWKQCRLDIQKSNLYSWPVGEKTKNLEMTRIMDRHQLNPPSEERYRLVCHRANADQKAIQINGEGD